MMAVKAAEGMRIPAIAALATSLVLGCGPSTVAWGDFQSRVLDGMDRYEEASDLSDPALLPYFIEEQKWAEGIKAEACYDPALRVYRHYLDQMAAAYGAVGGVPLSAVPLDRLQTARDALKQALDQYDRLQAAMLLATSACN